MARRVVRASVGPDGSIDHEPSYRTAQTMPAVAYRLRSGALQRAVRSLPLGTFALVGVAIGSCSAYGMRPPQCATIRHRPSVLDFSRITRCQCSPTVATVHPGWYQGWYHFHFHTLAARQATPPNLRFTNVLPFVQARSWWSTYVGNMRHHPSVRSLAFGRVRPGWRSSWRNHVSQVAHTGCGPLGSPLFATVRQRRNFMCFDDSNVRCHSPPFVHVVSELVSPHHSSCCQTHII
jgi:hypothetical protein